MSRPGRSIGAVGSAARVAVGAGCSGATPGPVDRFPDADCRSRAEPFCVTPVVTFMHPGGVVSRMDVSKILAVLFTVLMVTSMIAWGALAAF